MKPLFDKPLGGVEFLSPQIGVFSEGTHSAIRCGVCGTMHAELREEDDCYYFANFLGYLVVAHCCGKIFHWAFSQMGEAFAEAMMQKVAENPTDHEFFIGFVKSCMEKASEKMKRISAETDGTVGVINEMQKKA